MYDERFARQYRYEPPTEFLQSLPFTGIVHHLSGPSTCAHTQTSLDRSVGCWCKYPSSHLHYASKLTARELAHMLDSLVRVSRRVEGNHLVTILPWSDTASCRKRRAGQCTTHCASTALSKHEKGADTKYKTCLILCLTGHIRILASKLPCPKDRPQGQTSADIQAEKHQRSLTQTPPVHLRKTGGARARTNSNLSKRSDSIRFPFSEFMYF
jgi:hypothetical protein